MKAFRAWYYERGNENRWDVGGFDPRIGRNYGGFSNMVGILFESPWGQSLADGVRAGYLAYETVVEWARDNSDLLLETVSTARRETVEMGNAAQGTVPIDVEYAPEEEPVTYLIFRGPEDDREIIEIQSRFS